MNSKVKKIRNILLGITISIIVFVVVVILFISPVAKYVIQKYDVKYLGREITLDWIYVNPFTAYVHIHNLKVYEAGGMDTVFFSADAVSADYALLKTFRKIYEIQNITITHPWGRVVQSHAKLNFSDLIERFTPKPTSDTIKKVDTGPVHFNILNMEIKDGEFHYDEVSIPVTYFVKHVNIKSPGKWWNKDTMAVKYEIESGPATGTVKGVFNINLSTMDYSMAAVIKKYDLKFIEQYLYEFANYGSFTANVDADVKATGNLGKKLAVNANGWLAVNDFHFGKEVGEDYLAFNKLMINMIEVNPGAFHYYIDTIMIDKPFFKYEIYDHMDNITALFGKDLQNIKDVNSDQTRFNLVIEIGKYISDIAKNFLKSYYKINRVAIYSGNVEFNDFSLREKFSASANPLMFIADSIDKHHSRMNAHLSTGIKPYGNINVDISIDPNNYGTFDIKYKMDRIPVSTFNPYLLTYTSFPLDKGSLELRGDLNVVDSNIRSDNHLLILDPRVGKRLRKKQDTKWVPVPLIMSIVREHTGVIDYSIPIAGNLRDPKFKFKYVTLDILKNIFIKPPLSPYTFHVNDEQKQVEKYLTLKWETRKATLHEGQKIFMEKIAKYLKKTPDATIVVSPMEYTDKEKEYILFFEAKKKYRLRDSKTKVINEDDSIAIDRMSIKDSMFTRFLEKLVGDTQMFTIQEKCKYYVGEGVVNARFQQLMKDRQHTFMDFFIEEVKPRIKIATSQNVIPFNGFSYYKIEYNGEVPQKLREAYDEISEINDRDPRRQYEAARMKNGGVVPEAKAPPAK